MIENVDEIVPRMISVTCFPIFLFKRIELLQIQAYGQKKKSSEEPQQLKTVRSLKAFWRYRFLCKTQSSVWNVHIGAPTMKIVMFYKWDFKIVKKIFKVSSTIKKDRQLTGCTQCHTVLNRNFLIKTVGPQTKILKVWVEENNIFWS